MIGDFGFKGPLAYAKSLMGNFVVEGSGGSGEENANSSTSGDLQGRCVTELKSLVRAGIEGALVGGGLITLAELANLVAVKMGGTDGFIFDVCAAGALTGTGLALNDKLPPSLSFKIAGVGALAAMLIGVTGNFIVITDSVGNAALTAIAWGAIGGLTAELARFGFSSDKVEKPHKT